MAGGGGGVESREILRVMTMCRWMRRLLLLLVVDDNDEEEIVYGSSSSFSSNAPPSNARGSSLAVLDVLWHSEKHVKRID